MIVVTDTFPQPVEQYPHFVIPGGKSLELPSMATQGKTYDLSKDPETYIHRPMHGVGGQGCTCRGKACGCG